MPATALPFPDLLGEALWKGWQPCSTRARALTSFLLPHGAGVAVTAVAEPILLQWTWCLQTVMEPPSWSKGFSSSVWCLCHDIWHLRHGCAVLYVGLLLPLLTVTQDIRSVRLAWPHGPAACIPASRVGAWSHYAHRSNNSCGNTEKEVRKLVKLSDANIFSSLQGCWKSELLPKEFYLMR